VAEFRVHFSHCRVTAEKLTDSVDITGLAHTDKFVETITEAKLVSSCVLNRTSVHIITSQLSCEVSGLNGRGSNPDCGTWTYFFTTVSRPDLEPTQHPELEAVIGIVSICVYVNPKSRSGKGRWPVSHPIHYSQLSSL
jgi:hypothetical protein